ncbi:integrase, catalytic region, zinc finger, CCHC-type containing protein [Tanacetum coccineum]
MKPKKVGSKQRLASTKPRKPRTCLRWSPTGRMFDLKGKIIETSEFKCQSDSSKGCSKHMTGNSKLLINFVLKFLGTVRFGNDHIAAILGYGGHLEVSFRRNTCFIRNLEGVDLLKANRTTNLYTINLHEMAYASRICLMARVTSTKSWLCKEKEKKASHPPKTIPNSNQRLHLLLMDLYGTMRVESINRKRYILVKVDDYSRYTWVHFLISKDEAPKEIKIFLKKITVLLQAPDIINDHEDIGKLGAKGDIGFFIGYSTNSYAYRVYNRKTKKIIETINVAFAELSAMAFEQRSSKPRLQSMTSRQINMYDDYIGGQPSAATRTALVAQAPQVLQNPTTSTTIQQDNQAPLHPKIVADNVLNAMLDGNTFVNAFAPPSTSAAELSSSQYVDPSIMHTFYQPYPQEYLWNKDHPLEQVIGEP